MDGGLAMKLFIIVRPEPAGQYTAQAVGIPEIKATSSSREVAIQNVQAALLQSLASGQLVPVELPEENPLLRWYGKDKDDPYFEEYLEEIRRFRQEADERECSDSSSTPTT
jgi:hypothetical protein